MVSSASISASTWGLSLEKASCVASSLRSGGHRNRLATFPRTNDRTRSALELDHRRECVNRVHSFRSPATSSCEVLGVSPTSPPRGGFAFLVAQRERCPHPASVPYSYKREDYVRYGTKHAEREEGPTLRKWLGRGRRPSNLTTQARLQGRGREDRSWLRAISYILPCPLCPVSIQ